VVPARITVVTLGARDLPALRDFYVRLGWPAAIDLDDFAAFEMRGAVFTLYALDQLAADANASPPGPEPGFRGFNLAINVDRREEVDEVIEAAAEAGARVATTPTDAEWGGRSGYFVDPEDNYWEVAWVPPDSLMAGLVARAVGG
jgi:catechol 2,3-dioxygenase-like lactoylglutathione lyase family enzyme